MEPNKNVLPGIYSLIKESIDFYKKNYKVIFSIQLVLFVFYVVSALVSNVIIIFGLESDFVSGSLLIKSIIAVVFLVIGIITFVLQQASAIALLKTISELSRGVVVSVKEIYKQSFAIFLSVMWVYILFSLCTIPFLSLFLIPGIIISGYIFLAIYFNIIDGKKGLSSLAISYYYMKGNWWRVFWRSIGVGVISLSVGALALAFFILITFIIKHDLSVDPITSAIEFLGSFTVPSILATYLMNFINTFVVLPLMSIYIYLLFKYVKGLKNEPGANDNIEKYESRFKMIAILGAVLSVLIILAITTVVPRIKRAITKEAIGRIDLPVSKYVFPKDIVSLSMKLEFLQEEPYINKDLGFSINFPKDWMVDYNGRDVYSAIKIEGDSDANINVKKLSVSSIPYYFDSEDDLKFMELVAKKVVNNETTKLNDVKYFRYKINSLSVYQILGTIISEDGVIKINYNYIRSGNDVYFVSQAAKESVWPSMEETFMNSLSTFKAI